MNVEVPSVRKLFGEAFLDVSKITFLETLLSNKQFFDSYFSSLTGSLVRLYNANVDKESAIEELNLFE